MSVYKYTMIFSFTTKPVDGSGQSPRVAGWTESHWRATNDIVNFRQDRLITRRAALLPAGASISGFRITGFDETTGKLIQQSVILGAVNAGPGAAPDQQDIPQMSLQFRASATPPAVNTATFDIRGLPDVRVAGGAYNPSNEYAGLMSNFTGALVADSWGWVGVNKALPKVRVLKLLAGVVTLSAGSGLVAGNYVTFFRTKLDGGKSLKGTYLVTAAADPQYTLQAIDPAATISVPNGTARKHALAFVDYGAIDIIAVRTHKVGRPFFRYRGRRSGAA